MFTLLNHNSILCSFLRACFVIKLFYFPSSLGIRCERQSKNFTVRGNLYIRANICFMFLGSSPLIASYCPKTTYALFGNSRNLFTGGGDAGLTTFQ